MAPTAASAHLVGIEWAGEVVEIGAEVKDVSSRATA